MTTLHVTVPLPGGRTGKAEIQVDVERLGAALWWKAYYNKRKRATLQNGAVVLVITDQGSAGKVDP